MNDLPILPVQRRIKIEECTCKCKRRVRKTVVVAECRQLVERSSPRGGYWPRGRLVLSVQLFHLKFVLSLCVIEDLWTETYGLA